MRRPAFPGACVVIGLVLLAVGLSGCVDLARGAAEKPYYDAMKAGRMAPSEYQKAREEIRQASGER